MEEIIKRLDRIIELMEHEPSVKKDVDLSFKPANKNADSSWLDDRQKEIFESLDRNK